MLYIDDNVSPGDPADGRCIHQTKCIGGDFQMNKLQNVRNNLRKNGKKGFTLIELIVVIVIIAILVAALTPAILGVINRANAAADQADARSMMMGATVAGTLTTPPSVPTAAQIKAQFTGGVNITDGTYELFFDGPIAVGCRLTGGRTTSVVIGNTTGTVELEIEVSGETFTDVTS